MSGIVLKKIANDIADFLLYVAYKKHTRSRLFRTLIVHPLTGLLNIFRGKRFLLSRDVTRGKSFTKLKQILPDSFIVEGTILDIGSNDGFCESESYGFRQLGFRCLFVEPNPKILNRLSTAASPNDLIYPHAIDTEKYDYKLARHKDDLLETEVRILRQDDLYENTDFYTIYDAMETKTVKDLDDYIKIQNFPYPKIIKIDIESVELESRIIGKFLDFGYDPELIIVESGDRDSLLKERLLNAGYEKLLESGYNRYYLKQGH